jgi:2-amino-4-hydroxy-6-hydroxymethyldihydropteridine diphosphokinase
MNTAYLSLGSNIDPEKNLPEALHRLSLSMEICGVSSLWRTPSIGYDGPDFLNAAVCVKTNFDAHHLKEDILCLIEQEMGRIRQSNKNAPRPIDLDILLFNNQIMEPGLFTLDHLIFPLAELLPMLKEKSEAPPLQEIALQHLSISNATQFGKFNF